MRKERKASLRFTLTVSQALPWRAGVPDDQLALRAATRAALRGKQAPMCLHGGGRPGLAALFTRPEGPYCMRRQEEW